MPFLFNSGPWTTTARGCVLTAVFAAAGWASEPQANDAGRILDAINAAYEEIFPLPRHMILTSRTTTRIAGRPDRIVESRANVYQHGDAIRYELPPGAMRVDDSGAGRPAAFKSIADSQLWTLVAQQMKSRYVRHDPRTGEATVSEFFVDFTRIPERFGPRFHNPITAPELPEEFMEADWAVSEAFLHGRSVLRMRSRGIIALSPVAAMDVVFYVDPDTHLVARMESTSHRINPDSGISEAQVRNVTDMVYEIGKEVAPQVFEVTLGPGARDLTPDSIDYLRSKLLWRQEQAGN